MADLEYRFERDGYPTIELKREGGPYGLQSNSSGFGIGPIISQWRDSAADGDDLRGERVGAKAFDISLIVLAPTRPEVEQLLRNLANILRWRRGKPLARLVADYGDGRVYEVAVKYESGLEIDHSDGMEDLYKPVVGLVAPNPYWVSRRASEFISRTAGTSENLLSHLAALPLGQSSALGDFEAVNDGDLEVDIDWTINGPGGPVNIEINGEGWTLDIDLEIDESYTVLGSERMAFDGTGEPRYEDFVGLPRFPKIPVGTTQITVVMQNASPGSWQVSDDVLYQNEFTQPRLKSGSSLWTSQGYDGAVEAKSATGWNGGTDGQSRIDWAAAQAHNRAYHKITHTPTPGQPYSASMDIRTKNATVAFPAIWAFDANDLVVMVAIGPPKQIAGLTTTNFAVEGSALGPMPDNVARLEFIVSTEETSAPNWVAADAFVASHGQFTSTNDVMPFFTGASTNAAWVGAVDASASNLYALELVGQSQIIGSFRPLRELMY